MTPEKMTVFELVFSGLIALVTAVAVAWVIRDELRKSTKSKRRDDTTSRGGWPGGRR